MESAPGFHVFANMQRQLDLYIHWRVKQIDKIIKGCLDNDRQSQFRLYDYCFDPMMSICQRYEKDQDAAMDLLNQAFVKVLRKLETYQMELDLLPWVRKITANMAIDHYRKKTRAREIFDDNVAELEKEPASIGHVSLHWVEEEFLEHLLTQLKEAERTVFNLFAMDGFSHKEIAESLGITERSSIRHLTNARRKLQYHLSIVEPGIKKA